MRLGESCPGVTLELPSETGPSGLPVGYGLVLSLVCAVRVVGWL